MTFGLVEIILPNGRKICFESERYRKKEFLSERDIKRVIFIRLFQIYDELASHSRSI
ncbi:MAG: hypothetical protein ACFFDF_05235 [Candidatus Odinarchaeota archaeon]